MKVLLIQPPLLYYTKIIKSPNIGLASIAAVLEEAGIDVAVIDANAEGISLDEIIERIRQIKPDLVGSGGQTPISHLSLEIFRRTKKEVNKNIVTLAGGHHFSFTDEESLRQCPELDIVVRGEAEYTMRELCSHLNQGKPLNDIKGITYKDAKGSIIKNTARESIADIDALPFPAWHLFPVEKYHDKGLKMLAATTARGCIYKCPHCISWKIHKGVRLKSPKRIVDEMIYVKEHFGHDTFFFHDDQSFTDREQLEGFLNELERRNNNLFWSYETREEIFYSYKDLWDRMKTNGLFKIYFGVETINEEGRNFYNRSKYDKERFEEMLDYLEHKLDIIVGLYFIIGYPAEAEENIRRSLQYSKSLYPSLCSLVICSLLAPFPGTDLYREMKKKGLILTEDWRYYGSVTPVIKASVSSKELQKLYYSFWKNNYGRVTVIARQLINLFSKNKFRRYMGKGFFNTTTEIMKTKKISSLGNKSFIK
jgi:anaerobic magnesium-protoporphyrin IX monomethyl ester cyclase